MKVEVYFNLHRKCWSVRSHKTKKVISHSNTLFLKDCIFKVREGGRQKVLKTKQKNVHAFVIGILSDTDLPEINWKPITYNPYKYKSFVLSEDLTPLEKADYVKFDENSKVFAFFIDK